MENTRVFEVTVSVKECRESSATDVHIPPRYGKDALDELVKVLKAYGLEVETDTKGSRVKIRICHPEADQAERLRNRGGGRPKKRRVYDVSLEWLESHSVEEGMEALGGVSRRTYYRRLEEMRQRVQERS